MANGRYFGGGMSVSPDVGPFDGLLQLVCLRHRPLWRVVWLGLLVTLGRRPRGRDTVEASGGRVRLDTRRRHRVVADGEWLGQTPCEFHAWSGALRVFMPVSGAGSPRR